MGLFGILVSDFLSSVYILDISPLSNVGLVKFFSHSVGYRFVLLTTVDQQLGSQHGTDLDTLHMGDSCVAWSFVGTLAVRPGPVPAS